MLYFLNYSFSSPIASKNPIHIDVIEDTTIGIDKLLVMLGHMLSSDTTMRASTKENSCSRHFAIIMLIILVTKNIPIAIPIATIAKGIISIFLTKLDIFRYSPSIKSSREPEIPGITIAAAASIPETNNFIAYEKLIPVYVAIADSLSEIIAKYIKAPMINAPNENDIRFLIPKPFTSFVTNGREPSIRPTKNICVGMGYVVNKISMMFKKTTTAIAAPIPTGISIFIGLIHCFGLNIMLGIIAIEFVNFSYMPSIKASVPPDTPGIALAIPITKPFIKSII